MKTHSTRLKLDNSPGLYPCLQIRWMENVLQNGWEGTAQVWHDGNTKDGGTYLVSLSQSIPLGAITIQFEPCPGGCLKMASFEGSRLDERDLQWATAWTALAIELKSHNRYCDYCNKLMLPHEPFYLIHADGMSPAVACETCNPKPKDSP